MADFDRSSSIFQRCPIERVTKDGRDYDKYTCTGILTFTPKKYTHEGGVKKLGYNLFSACRDFSDVIYIYLWKVLIPLDLNAAEIETATKTKFMNVYCQKCECPEECVISVQYKIYATLHELNKWDEERASTMYTYQDRMYVKFEVDIKTRSVTLDKVHCGIDTSGPQWEVPSKYYCKREDYKENFASGSVVQSSSRTDWKLGWYHCHMEVAGPASMEGLDFVCQWTFKLESNAPTRMLERLDMRVLQTATSKEVVKATTPNTKVIGTGPEPRLVAQQLREAVYPQVSSINGFIAAILALVAVTCLCATVSNVVPLLRKKEEASA